MTSDENRLLNREKKIIGFSLLFVSIITLDIQKPPKINPFIKNDEELYEQEIIYRKSE